MKKFTTLALGIIFASAIMTGCKKDHTCTCKDQAGNTVSSKIEDSSKKDATDACETMDKAAQVGGGSCSLD